MITRTGQTLNFDVSPEEAAKEFMHGDTHWQAAFLNECGRLAKEPQGQHGRVWFEHQVMSITHDEGVAQISDDAKNFLRLLEGELTGDNERAQKTGQCKTCGRFRCGP